MKLVIQIPCHDEAATLGATVAALPRELPGFTAVEWLVIDDGSTDGTAEVARALGVQHLVAFPARRGLAAAFSAGLDAALAAGADVIVNTDGDNQYAGADIAALVAPILEGRADLVVGDRNTATIAHFSWTRRRLQALGSAIVRWTSGTAVPDATSGFRAFNRQAALRLAVVSGYSYTLETLIQAGAAHLAVLSVPVRTNPPTRPSRLIRSLPRYLYASGLTILRATAWHRPLEVFGGAAALCAVGAAVLGGRFLYFHLTRDQAGHTQSVILAAILAIAAFVLGVAGVLADAVRVNRELLLDLRVRVREAALDTRSRPEER